TSVPCSADGGYTGTRGRSQCRRHGNRWISLARGTLPAQAELPERGRCDLCCSYRPAPADPVPPSTRAEAADFGEGRGVAPLPIHEYSEALRARCSTRTLAPQDGPRQQSHRTRPVG